MLLLEGSTGSGTNSTWGAVDDVDATYAVEAAVCRACVTAVVIAEISSGVSWATAPVIGGFPLLGGLHSRWPWGCTRICSSPFRLPVLEISG